MSKVKKFCYKDLLELFSAESIQCSTDEDTTLHYIDKVEDIQKNYGDLIFRCVTPGEEKLYTARYYREGVNETGAGLAVRGLFIDCTYPIENLMVTCVEVIPVHKTITRYVSV